MAISYNCFINGYKKDNGKNSYCYPGETDWTISPPNASKPTGIHVFIFFIYKYKNFYLENFHEKIFLYYFNFIASEGRMIPIYFSAHIHYQR